MDFRITFRDGRIAESVNNDDITEAIKWVLYWHKDYKVSDIIKVEKL